MLFDNFLDIIYNNEIILKIVGISYLLDFLTGITKAIIYKNIKSSKLKRSIGKGFSYFAYITMSCCIQVIFPLEISLYKFIELILPIDIPVNEKAYPFFLYLSCIYIIITEFISVTENTKKFTKGIPFISKFLKTTKNKIDNISIDEESDLNEK